MPKRPLKSLPEPSSYGSFSSIPRLMHDNYNYTHSMFGCLIRFSGKFIPISIHEYHDDEKLLRNIGSYWIYFVSFGVIMHAI